MNHLHGNDLSNMGNRLNWNIDIKDIQHYEHHFIDFNIKEAADNPVEFLEKKLLNQTKNIHSKALPILYKKKDIQETIQFFEFMVLYEYSRRSKEAFLPYTVPPLKKLGKVFHLLENLYEFTSSDIKLKKASYVNQISHVINKINEVSELLGPIDKLALSKYIKKGIKILKAYEDKIK